MEAATLSRIKERGQAIFRTDAIIGASFDARPLKKTCYCILSTMWS